jgi:hypothetical protein
MKFLSATKNLFQLLFSSWVCQPKNAGRFYLIKPCYKQGCDGFYTTGNAHARQPEKTREFRSTSSNLCPKVTNREFGRCCRCATVTAAMRLRKSALPFTGWLCDILERLGL